MVADIDVSRTGSELDEKNQSNTEVGRRFENYVFYFEIPLNKIYHNYIERDRWVFDV